MTGSKIEPRLQLSSSTRWPSDRLTTPGLVGPHATIATDPTQGWAWVEARIEVDSHALRQFAPGDHVGLEPTLQEQEELGALSRRSDELGRQAQALDDAPEWSADEAEIIDLEEQDIAARRKAIHDDLKTWAPKAMAHAGAIVTANREGDAKVIRGLLREVDRKALAGVQKVVSRATGVAADHVPDGSQSGAIVTERRTPDCSERLAKRLAAHRNVALQVMLSRNTPVALASLAHVLVQRAFGDEYRRAGSALQITTQPPEHTLLSVADDLKESAACQAVEAAKLTCKARLPEQASTPGSLG